MPLAHVIFGVIPAKVSSLNPSFDICVYGSPSLELVDYGPEAVQVSPLFPGSADLADVAPESLSSVILAAPPGTVERRRAIALSLRALKDGGSLVVLAPKDKGGSRLSKELAAFGCDFEETSKRHNRICFTTKTEGLTGLEEAITAGAAVKVPGLGLWSQPGVFSWDRLDQGTALLMSALPALKGHGADFGCGVGVIALQALKSPAVAKLELIDIDRRAIDAARRNIDDARVRFHWADIRSEPALEGLDFVVCNPPFHDGGAEDHALGQAFIRRARAVLRSGGSLWIVANRHLPYEAVLTETFKTVERRADAGGYKVYEARR